MENEDVWELWQNVATQIRTGSGGVIGYDYPAIFQTADKLGIIVDAIVLRKIRVLEGSFLAAVYDKSGTSNDENNDRVEYCKACREAKLNVSCDSCDLNTIRTVAATGKDSHPGRPS